VIQFLISWGPALLWAGLLYLQSAQSSVPNVGWLPLGDKVGHFLLYAILGLTLAWGSRNFVRKGFHWGVVLAGFLFAASDEWHQAFVPGREPSFGDFVADTGGLLLGFLLFRSLLMGRKTALKTGL
jgi:VanZ family protein